MPSLLDRATDIATFLAGVSAAAVAVVVVTRPPVSPPGLEASQPREIDEWKSLLEAAHRVGTAEAPVTIIEFGDYQCPGCRAWQPHIEAILRKFPNDVALYYKHWPLSYHQLAYPAARAVECANAQGRFWEMHTTLYRNENWLGDALLRFADGAGVADLGAFADCLADTAPIPVVEQNIAEALEIGAPGTPAVIVNGLLLGQQRDSLYLETLIRRVR